MSALYELAAEYREAAHRLADTDLDEQTIADTLDGMAGEIEQKAVAVAMVIRNIKAEEDAIQQAVAGMVERQKAKAKTVERLKDYLKNNLEACGLKKVESPYFVVSVRANPASVVIDDESAIPTMFLVHPPAPAPRPDKTAIKEAIKAGANVPGAHVSSSTRIDIK